jgi:glutamate dehydrogenase/leucine dehydrogenase
VDILVPAALEDVIDEKNAGKIRAKYVLELANGPVTPEAEVILDENGVVVVPDVLANAGGVSTSYFEWVQNNMGYYWEEKEVLAKLRRLMESAFEEVWGIYSRKINGKESGTMSMRMAAYVYAVERVLRAMRLRG